MIIFQHKTVIKSERDNLSYSVFESKLNHLYDDHFHVKRNGRATT